MPQWRRNGYRIMSPDIFLREYHQVPHTAPGSSLVNSIDATDLPGPSLSPTPGIPAEELDPPKRLVLAPGLGMGSAYDVDDGGCGARRRKGLESPLLGGE